MTFALLNATDWLRFFFWGDAPAPDLAPDAVTSWLDWLAFHQLTVFAWHRLREADRLTALPSQAQSVLHEAALLQGALARQRQAQLEAILQACRQADIEMTLLKGAALTLGRAYADPAWRLMGDFDLWVLPEQMPDAVALMRTLGFTVTHKPHRPYAMRVAEQAEIEMHQTGVLGQAVDLHYHPFQGKWLAAVLPAEEERRLWQRRAPILCETGPIAYRLAAEDHLLHLAVHIAINHQFGAPGLRALWDIAASLRAWPVSWPTVVTRAKRWHLQTPLWLSLSLATRWCAAPVPDAVLDALRPARWRRRALRQVLPPSDILRGSQLSASHRRYLYLLLALDDAKAGPKLVRQALLPKIAWLRQRYPELSEASRPRLRLHHLHHVLRSPRF